MQLQSNTQSFNLAAKADASLLQSIVIVEIEMKIFKSIMTERNSDERHTTVILLSLADTSIQPWQIISLSSFQITIV